MIRRIQPTAIPLTRLHIHTPLTPSINTLLIQQMDFLPIILFNERFFEIDHSGKQIIDIPQTKKNPPMATHGGIPLSYL